MRDISWADSLLEKCAWAWYSHDTSLVVLLCAHVDDVYFAAASSLEEHLLCKMRALFLFGKVKRGPFEYRRLQNTTECDENGELQCIVTHQYK